MACMVQNSSKIKHKDYNKQNGWNFYSIGSISLNLWQFPFVLFCFSGYYFLVDRLMLCLGNRRLKLF